MLPTSIYRPPRTARTYPSGWSSCSAARRETLNTGSAASVKAEGEHRKDGDGCEHRRCRVARLLASGGAGFQNASSQSRAIDSSVSRLTASAMTCQPVVADVQCGLDDGELGDETRQGRHAGEREERNHGQHRDRRYACDTSRRAPAARLSGADAGRARSRGTGS